MNILTMGELGAVAESGEPLHVVVIGAGPGGYPAAFRAAKLGLRVTLIDPEARPGGVCLHRGCIPSKALLHAAELMRSAAKAGAMGLEFDRPRVDLDRLRSWKDDVIAQQTRGLASLALGRRVEYVRGWARFLDSKSVEVDGDELRVIEFDAAIIATGSSPAVPESLALPSARVMDSTAALEIEEVPKTLLVVGGGYIGLELGTVYAALGSQVTLVEMLPGLLPGADRDLVEPLARRVEGEFKEILLETQVVGMKQLDDSVAVMMSGLREGETEREFARVLVAAGRNPNNADMGLEHTSVSLDRKGFIVTDSRQRTTDPAIFAVGDVAGEPMLAHKATHEGHVAAEVIAGRPTAFEIQAIPAVVFTDPEVAWCGVSETEAAERKLDVEVSRYPWVASGRAGIVGGGDGLTKLIVEPRTERLLGAGIVGSGAGELIAECVQGIEMAATINDLELSTHPHPTLSETVMEAAALFHDKSPNYMAR